MVKVPEGDLLKFCQIIGQVNILKCVGMKPFSNSEANNSMRDIYTELFDVIKKQDFHNVYKSKTYTRTKTSIA